jgi:hypothetical protein
MAGINPQMNMMNPYQVNNQYYPQGGYQDQFRYGNTQTMGKVRIDIICYINFFYSKIKGSLIILATETILIT